jgi:hypothetical protein
MCHHFEFTELPEDLLSFASLSYPASKVEKLSNDKERVSECLKYRDATSIPGVKKLMEHNSAFSFMLKLAIHMTDSPDDLEKKLDMIDLQTILVQ